MQYSTNKRVNKAQVASHEDKNIEDTKRYAGSTSFIAIEMLLVKTYNTRDKEKVGMPTQRTYMQGYFWLRMTIETLRNKNRISSDNI